MPVPSQPTIDRVTRALVTLAYRLVRPGGGGDMNDRPGAHALALTPDQRIILVKLRYARGWRLPGGGRKADESIADGALRELTEEVGLTEHGAVTPLPDIDPSLVMVEGVRFRPARWSLEIEQVIAVAVDELPRDLSPRACQWIEAARSRIIR